MKLPHKITVWNRSDDEKYTRVVIDGVYWEENRGAQMRKTNMSADNGIFVLIPFAVVRPGFAIRAKDWIALDDVQIEAKQASDFKDTGAVMVSAVDKYACGGMPHWEVTGK